MRDLLEVKEPDADLFFATQTNIGWMRDLENEDFAKVFVMTYKFQDKDFFIDPSYSEKIFSGI